MGWGLWTFESNVILDRYKTNQGVYDKVEVFESNVILDRYKTIYNDIIQVINVWE